MVVIRQMVLSDIKDVYEIERKSFTYPFTESFILSIYFSSPDLCIIAENSIHSKIKVVGFLLGSRTENKNEAHILSIAVLEEYRQKGYGKKLLEKFIEEVTQLGYSRIRLEVKVTNDIAISLYEKMNFVIKDRLRKYYEDNSDAYVMVWEKQ